MPQTALSYALGVWAGAVAFKDYTRRRVPNALLLLLLVPAALAVIVNGQGLMGVTALQSVAGMLVAGLPLLPGYALGYMGAGDVKFAACLGLLLGPGGALELLLGAALMLGAASTVILWFSRAAARGRRLPAAPAFAAAFGLQLLYGRLLPLGI